MVRIEKSVVIDAPTEKVFAYVMDPAKAPEYMTGVDEITDVQRLPNGGYRYKIIGKAVGIRYEMTSEDIEVVPNERVVTKVDSPFLDAIMYGRLEPQADGKTRMSFAAEFTPHGGPLAKLGEGFFTKYFEHSSELEIEAIKAHIEAEELAATPS